MKDNTLIKRTLDKIKKGKVLRRPPPRRRPAPAGPSRVICVVIEKASGLTVTQAAGNATSKYSADTMARQNALRALKKKLKRHFSMANYVLAYRYG